MRRVIFGSSEIHLLGTCNFLDDKGNRCNKTYNLHSLYFRDPYSPTSSQFIDLCKWHYDAITADTTERIRGFQMKLSNLISESARLRKIARENGTYIRNEVMTQKIEDLKALIKKITTNECKNFFCMANLRELERYAKLYSVHTFKPSGRRHYTFYYCSLKCYNIMRARCGLPVPIHQGQTMLNP